MSHTQEMGPQLSAARNKLLLKIHGTLLTGTIGLVLLVSVLFRKPLLLPFFQAFGQSGPNGTTLLDRAAIDPASRDANPGLPLPASYSLADRTDGRIFPIFARRG